MRFDATTLISRSVSHSPGNTHNIRRFVLRNVPSVALNGTRSGIKDLRLMMIDLLLNMNILLLLRRRRRIMKRKLILRAALIHQGLIVIVLRLVLIALLVVLNIRIDWQRMHRDCFCILRILFEDFFWGFSRKIRKRNHNFKLLHHK